MSYSLMCWLFKASSTTDHDEASSISAIRILPLVYMDYCEFPYTSKSS